MMPQKIHGIEFLVVCAVIFIISLYLLHTGVSKIRKRMQYEKMNAV